MVRFRLRLARFCGWIAAAFLAAMMALTVSDVVLRGVFNFPIRGSFELVELLLAGTFFFALPASFLRDEHIVVDMVDGWAPALVPWLRRLASLVAIAVLVTMAWQGAKAARDTLAFGDVTSDLSLPRIYYWVPVLFGFAGAAIAAFLMLIRRDGEG